jgi:hypothetical protein
MHLLEREAFLNLIRERMQSREWRIVLAGPADDALPRLIEKRHYQGDENPFFGALLMPRSLLEIVFARKREMSVTQLARCVIDVGSEDITLQAL